MPTISNLVYAALLYKDGGSSEEFVEATAGEDNKLIFSFQKPDNTSGAFTLEVFAFKAGTSNFSKTGAPFSKAKSGLTITGETINVGDIALEVNDLPGLTGTVSLQIKVPAGCSLEIKELKADCAPESNPHFKIDETLPEFTITQNGTGISAGTYQVEFTVKKVDGDKTEIVYIFTESINVLPGMCTDTWWNGAESSATKEITQGMVSSTVYVRGAGGWYTSNASSATASDEENTGSYLSPFATIQKAVDAIIARNDGASPYTIYLDGTLTQSAAPSDGKKGMADFSALDKKLNLTIMALSGTATLDAKQKSRVIYAMPSNTSIALNLTLENLVITGGNAPDNGGGIYFRSTGGTLAMNGGSITGNTATQDGGGVYVNGGAFTMSGSAFIPVGDDGKNDVCLTSGNTITVAGPLSESKVATITLPASSYAAGTPILSKGADASAPAITQGICDKFALSDEDWKIVPSADGTAGVLMPDSALYVSSGGDDTNGDGTKAKPFATLQKAFDTIKDLNDSTASYKIRISGTVVGGCEVSGISAANVLITGTSADTDILDGGGASRIFRTFSSVPIEIRNVKITNGGYCISVNNDNAIVTLGSGAEVYVNKHTGVNVPFGTFILDGGAILNDGASYNGNPVYFSGEKFIMKSGTIQGGTFNSGGCVFIGGGEFIMEGGTISGGTAASSGGGSVYVNSGKFTMSGGEITGNTATTNGGGVYVAKNGTFTMEGGTISGNTAETNGGGVYNNGTFEMSGGEITGNTATTQGGGVYNTASATFTNTGGTVSGNFLSDNTPDNVYTES